MQEKKVHNRKANFSRAHFYNRIFFRYSLRAPFCIPSRLNCFLPSSVFFPLELFMSFFLFVSVVRIAITIKLLLLFALDETTLDVVVGFLHQILDI